MASTSESVIGRMHYTDNCCTLYFMLAFHIKITLSVMEGEKGNTASNKRNVSFPHSVMSVYLGGYVQTLCFTAEAVLVFLTEPQLD